MAQAPRTIDHQLAYSMFPIWLGAILLLLFLLAWAQIPAATRIEEQRMKDHLLRVSRVVQSDVAALDAFSRDWGIWDDSHRFIGNRNRMYIESNLFNDMPMRDFSLNLMSFMDLGGHEIWTRTLLPDAPGINPDQFPYFLDELKKQLKEQSMAQGGANLHGIRASQWGPLMYSWQPIRNSDGSAPFNGFLLVMRWLDTAYLEQVSQRTELPLAISHTNLDVTASFKPLKSQMTYRLIDLGLDRLRGEVRLLNSDNLPVLTLVIEEERKVLGSVLEGALWTFVGMLFISFICIMIAMYRLNSIVLTPLQQLVSALQRFGDRPDANLIPFIDSSAEMATLSGKFREMASKVSQQHDALLERSCQMEMAAFTDPLTRCFNRRYLDGWLQANGAKPCLLLLLDLDHFKRINDRFGHDIGDLVLKQLAELLRKLVVSESEPIIRLGGEEFLLLLQVDNEQELALRAEYLRLRVAQHRFGFEDRPLWLTVSLGYCRYPLHPECPDSFWSHSFKLADMALYQAKLGGRNRWCGYGGSPYPGDLMGQTPEQLVEGAVLTRYSSASLD
ncbi:sensor domain-containing diguanylate cyclase [Aeromonas allosaccharophila]|uniref:sensor domain-containing diguanylate cyclase n=1 Tax=Aeromonas allosaccharophila TaxID=656 RepID=UPI0011171703|nr:diguanylate cyclase [Aeromonas allosaccharophila]TNI86531.1 diguanylate cyclase [Aeromonas allosaccharophila]